MYYSLLFFAMVLTIAAQVYVNSTYSRFAKVKNTKGFTGADVARKLLELSDVTDVRVELVGGHLTDHYDPGRKVLRLSESVYHSASVAALGVAAHETGHAIQHNQDYAFLRLRSAMVPITRFGSMLSVPLILLGFFVTSMMNSQIGPLIMMLGIVLFSIAILFSLVTLPVEFNASSRAIALLDDHQFLNDDELRGARKVLNAAALTYVAAAAVAIINLIRLLAMVGFFRNRD